MAQILRSVLRRRAHGEVRLQGGTTLLGLDSRYIRQLRTDGVFLSIAELIVVVLDQMRTTFTTPSSSIIRVLASVVGVIPPTIIKSPPAGSKT